MRRIIDYPEPLDEPVEEWVDEDLEEELARLDEELQGCP